MDPDIVTIRKQAKTTKVFGRLLSAPLIHKFFLVGLLFGVIGTTVIGVTLWLGLNGQIQLQPLLFLIFKNLHTLIQIHLFLGLFIAGFYLQTAPKLFEVPNQTGNSSLVLLLPFLIAAACLVIVPHLHLHRYILAFAFFCVAAVIGRYALMAKWQNRLRMGVLSVFGLCSLAIGAFAELADPKVAVVVFWCGIMSVILAVSQQFIIWILGGHKLKSLESLTLLAAFLLAATFGIASVIYPAGSNAYLRCMGLTAIITLGYFVIMTQAAKQAIKQIYTPMGLALFLAGFWSMIGSILLCYGAQHSDAALHVWGTGVAFTLILAVSSRVLGVLSGRNLFGTRMMTLLLLTWQLVPLGRGLAAPLGIPPSLAWVTSLAAISVFAVWGILIAQRAGQILLRQLYLTSGQSLPDC